ncbi:DNA-binding transcriptional regulator, ArsR family [Sphingobacterium lactis]|uniref:DNA-binding transcriptional regulator, ArsR family n=2 Tax=Sphingobacterium lactis TaxID=797291 RepID=A0A1H6C021_9SPHI|nr:DNA-binding transcriptional regulator, ArsR family [Sphingobacterium lactis]
MVAFIFATEWFHKIKIMRRDIYQAIADPTRRAILALIATQAMTPNAIAGHFSTSRQAISKHLRILTECELVQTKTQGREIHYALVVDRMKEIDQWLSQFRTLWENRFEQLDELLITIKNQEHEK